MAKVKKNAAAVALGGLGGAWYLRDFVDSPDPRYRALVDKLAEAGYLESERDAPWMG